MIKLKAVKVKKFEKTKNVRFFGKLFFATQTQMYEKLIVSQRFYFQNIKKYLHFSLSWFSSFPLFH